MIRGGGQIKGYGGRKASLEKSIISISEWGGIGLERESLRILICEGNDEENRAQIFLLEAEARQLRGLLNEVVTDD